MKTSLVLIFSLATSFATASGPVAEDYGATSCRAQSKEPLREDMDRALTMPKSYGAGEAQITGLIKKLRTAYPSLCENPVALNDLNLHANMMATHGPETDGVIFRMPDYWQTPAELFSMKMQLGRFGDCEDFALLKYWILRRIGCDADNMNIVVLRSGPKDWHAVLTVHVPGKGALVLDNARGVQVKYMHETIYPSFGKPAYFINEEKVKWTCE